SKKRTLSMQTIGYVLLWGGIILLLARACTFVSSLGNTVPQPDTSSSPQPALITASIDKGMVYFTANDGIHALRASDGKQMWQNFGGSLNPPVVANGLIYEVNFRNIVAFSANDGRQLWNYFSFDDSDGAQPGNTQIVQITGDRLYAYDGQVLDVLVPASGARVWSTNDATNAVDINTLTLNNGIAYYAMHSKGDTTTTPTTTPIDDAIVARRVSDGRILWMYSLSHSEQSCAIASIAPAGDALYASASCGNSAGRTFALGASDGALLWQSSISGQFSVTNGVVFIHVTQASPVLADLYVLEAGTGKLLWQDAPGSSQHQTQAWTPGNGYVYLLDNGTLNARRLSDGQAAWSMGFPYNAASPTFETFSNPVFLGALNNIIYLQSSVVNQNTHVAFNRLYALQASTGKQLWSFQRDQFNLTWSGISVDASANTVAIQGLDTQHPTAVYLLRAADGELLGSILQSQAASAVLIANHTIYITSISGDGNATPFSYHIETFQASNQGSQPLWTFAA
ncbi:MAG TPA: PQQ-binding-like beta-propeller repeat protein, partial [Ktedonobacteraceae bacterium]